LLKGTLKTQKGRKGYDKDQTDYHVRDSKHQRIFR